jgi:phytoene synthase
MTTRASLADEGYREAARITRGRARSFAFASVALDRATRRAAFATYAFCRRCDDAVDGVAVPEARAGVARLRGEVARMYAGDDGGDAILAAFGDTVRARGVPREAIVGLIDGMEQDLTVNRYATWAELDRYCELAAGTVGRMMAAILGTRDAAALVPAAALGRAMQLTNVMRDVREDFVEHGRVYMPEEELARRGLSVAWIGRACDRGGLGDGAEAEAFRDLMREGARRARALYAEADRGIPRITSGPGRACVRLMRATYAEILNELEARGWDAFRGRASTSAATKVRVGARALAFAPLLAGGAT